MSNVDKPLDSSMWRERPAGREVKPPPSPAEALAIWRSTGKLPNPERKAEAKQLKKQVKQHIESGEKIRNHQYGERADKYIQATWDADKKYGLRHGTIASLVKQESNWDPKAFNKRSGAQGIAQIVPKWHPTVKDAYDPFEAIDRAGAYVAENQKRFGSLKASLYAYNMGPTAYQSFLDGNRKMKKETINYAPSILARLEESKAGSSIDKPLK